MMEVCTLDIEQLQSLLDRLRKSSTIVDPTPLGQVFAEILRVSNEFIPSLAGSVMLDDPILKRRYADDLSRNELIFVACFGEKAKQLVGKRIAADRGISGTAYRLGEPYISQDVSTDQNFFSKIDKAMDYRTESIICAPIRIEKATVGVIELLNRVDQRPYEDRDVHFLGVLAGYISLSLRTVLEAKRSADLSRQDDLTGLYNDRYFHYRITAELEQAEETGDDLTLIFLDLDHFKQVNDEYGHLVGSGTLKEIGIVLSSTVKDGVIARYGGDEFVIIVPGMAKDGAVQLGEDIRAAIATTSLHVDPCAEGIEPVTLAGLITASIGVTTFAEWRSAAGAGQRKDQLIKMADEAMYEAKKRGKNRSCYRSAAGPSA